MYIITGKSRIFRGGRMIAPSDIDIQCTEKQIEQLIKIKAIKKIKEKKVVEDGKETSRD